MDSSKLAVKFFFDSPGSLRSEDFIPVFHRWIQHKSLPGHQLIDVADYGHVPEGPGTVLVSHEANIHADLDGGRFGLLYIRKHPLPGSFKDRLGSVLTSALQAAALLESEPSLQGLKIKTGELSFQINDRLAAPNTAETFAALKPELEAVFKGVYNVASVELSHKADKESLFEVIVSAPQSPSIEQLLSRCKQ
jgi:hypothetical protein